MVQRHDGGQLGHIGPGLEGVAQSGESRRVPINIGRCPPQQLAYPFDKLLKARVWHVESAGGDGLGALRVAGPGELTELVVIEGPAQSRIALVAPAGAE